jgi:hypothetical protein
MVRYASSVAARPDDSNGAAEDLDRSVESISPESHPFRLVNSVAAKRDWSWKVRALGAFSVTAKTQACLSVLPGVVAFPRPAVCLRWRATAENRAPSVRDEQTTRRRLRRHNSQLVGCSWRKCCAESTLGTGQATTRAASGLTHQGPVAYRIRLVEFLCTGIGQERRGMGALLARAIRPDGPGPPGPSGPSRPTGLSGATGPSLWSSHIERGRGGSHSFSQGIRVNRISDGRRRGDKTKSRQNCVHHVTP